MINTAIKDCSKNKLKQFMKKYGDKGNWWPAFESFCKYNNFPNYSDWEKFSNFTFSTAINFSNSRAIQTALNYLPEKLFK